jgi:glutathione synthase/RimK-type ligase-like ATP-grasp enzyme
MSQIVVVENTRRWPLQIPGVDVVPARAYLLDPSFSERRGVTVYNLCRTYGYQTLGYYVSLLAAARGHRPLPSVVTLQDIRTPHLLRVASEDLEELIERTLQPLKADAFELSIYFGRNVASRYDRLSRALFNQFPAPLLRARFVRNGSWRLDRLRPIATSEIPDAHRDFVLEWAKQYLTRPRRHRRARQVYRYDLAILFDEREAEPPSDPRAIRRFVRAAEELGIDADVIGPEDYGRIAEFDALFIRQTTAVDHLTFRFAQRAAAEGLVVIDDPESILRCCSKVYQAETFARHGVPTPRTLVVDADDADRIEREVGLPCVLKRPDSSFSQGVVRVETRAELATALPRALENSELAIAQEYTPSSFDWRIGVLEGEAFYACRYHMARGHWQIVDGERRRRYGKVECVPLDDVPRPVLEQARKSARLIGSSFYGVDVKEIGRRVLVMEVNDNPSVEGGYEDRLLGDELYRAVMRYFRRRLEARVSAPPPR